MRLSLRIDEDVYAVAKALAHSEHVSIGRAINHLARQGFQRSPGSKRRLTDFPVSKGKRLFTAEDVYQIAFDEQQAPKK
jgi:hypothetical protein